MKTEYRYLTYEALLNNKLNQKRKVYNNVNLQENGLFRYLKATQN